MDLVEVIRVIRTRWYVMVPLLLLTIALTIGVDRSIPTKYQSTSEISLLASQSATTGTTTLPNTLNPGGAAGNQRNHGILYLAATNVLNVGYNVPLATYQAPNATNALELSRNPGNTATLSCTMMLRCTSCLVKRSKSRIRN